MHQRADIQAQGNFSGVLASKGLRSIVALIAMSLVGVVTGLWITHQGKAATIITRPVTAELVPPPPATTLTDARVMHHVPGAIAQSGKLNRNDTLIDLTVRLGAEHTDAYAALNALYETGLIDPRRLRPGLEMTAYLQKKAGDTSVRKLTALTLREDGARSLIVKQQPDETWLATALETKLIPAHKRVATEITTSIYDAALANGARDQQVVDFAGIFAYDVDFQREIYPGDRFEIVYEAWVDERGTPIRSGNILYASLEGKATTRGFYRFTPSDDVVTDYFDSKGESATKFLMKTPINGARLSSSFGRRRHPILGYTRMHKGTDFAAPRGTPIYAAGNGTIKRASRFGSFGNYIRIRHANGYETAYAHLNGYARGIRSGRRVRQGQTIGYVGTTGRSTGPHLHYEVLVNGRQVNAMRLNLPTGRKLEGDVLDRFQKRRREIDQLRQTLGAEIDVASLQAPDETSAE